MACCACFEADVWGSGCSPQAPNNHQLCDCPNPLGAYKPASKDNTTQHTRTLKSDTSTWDLDISKMLCGLLYGIYNEA